MPWWPRDVQQELPAPRTPVGRHSIPHDDGWATSVNVVGATGDLLAVTIYGEQDVAVYSIGTGLNMGYLRGHVRDVYAVLRLDGDKVVTAGSDGYVRLWDVREMLMLNQVQVSQYRVTAMAILDANHLVTGDSFGEVAVHRFDGNFIGGRIASAIAHGTGRHGERNRNPLEGMATNSTTDHGWINGRVWSIAAQGDTVVTGGMDGWALEFVVCRLENGFVHDIREVRRSKHDTFVRSVAINENYVATASFNEVRVWLRSGLLVRWRIAVRLCSLWFRMTRSTRAERRTTPSLRVKTRSVIGSHSNRPIHTVQFLDDGTMMTAGGDGTLAVYNLDDFPGSPQYRLDVCVGHQKYPYAVYDVAVLDCKQQVAVCGPWDPRVHLFQVHRIVKSRGKFDLVRDALSRLTFPRIRSSERSIEVLSENRSVDEVDPTLEILENGEFS